MSSVDVVIMAHGEWFANAPSHPPFRPVNLETLPLPKGVPNQLWLSECIVFLTDVLLQTEAEYVWLASGRYNQKWVERLGKRTRLEDLPQYLSTDCIWCTCVGPHGQWRRDDEEEHPGMGAAIDEMLTTFKLVNRHDTAYANSLCFPRAMLPTFLSKFREMFEYFQAKYGTELPFRVGTFDEARKGSYFYERVSMAILADWPDLVLRQTP
jgi:hypothetical protein